MKLDEMHSKLVSYYTKSRALKKKRSSQIQSIVGQSYKKKTSEVEQMSSFDDFLRNQKHIAAESEPLYFRTLPKNLLGPPEPPPRLEQIPYTYEIVPKVAFRMPKQKPGYIGDWILDECGFKERPLVVGRKNKSAIGMNRTADTEKRQSILDASDKKTHFRSEIKRIAKEMKQKNLSLKEVIKNKGLIKKSHNFYNSVEFFQMVRTGDPNIESLLERNPELAFDTDEQKMTGLHWAARQGHSDITRLLIQKYRASPMAKDCYGRTPLHLAVSNRNIECLLRIFIEGGKLSSLNNKKQSVRSMAKDSYIKYLLQKLEEIKFVVKSKKIADKQQAKQHLQEAVRSILDDSSLYF